MAFELVRFSIASPYVEILDKQREEGESIHQAAKRLISNLLEGDRQSSPMPPDLGDRLESLERRVEDLWEESKDFSALSRSEERLDSLEHRLEKLESAMTKNGQPAIMIQKQPLLPAMEIMRTHEEAAKDWGKSLATVRRWAKDPDKWPDGWLWDGDRQFWVKGV